MLEDAIIFATNYHYEQKQKSGLPYILHPLHVMGQVRTEKEKIVAVLHDVVEDTPATLEEIQEDFGEEIATAVDLLTKKEGQEYEKYIYALSFNNLARAVKIADIKHNLDLTRNETVVTSISKLNKYLWALQVLEDEI